MQFDAVWTFLFIHSRRCSQLGGDFKPSICHIRWQRAWESTLQNISNKIQYVVFGGVLSEKNMILQFTLKAQIPLSKLLSLMLIVGSFVLFFTVTLFASLCVKMSRLLCLKKQKKKSLCDSCVTLRQQTLNYRGGNCSVFLGWTRVCAEEFSCVCGWQTMEELSEGVMYLKKLNVLNRSDHVPSVRKTGKKEEERWGKKWYAGTGKWNKWWVCDLRK